MMWLAALSMLCALDKLLGRWLLGKLVLEFNDVDVIRQAPLMLWRSVTVPWDDVYPMYFSFIATFTQRFFGST
jgi:hypothetical protein